MKNKDIKRKEALIREYNYWKDWKNIPPNKIIIMNDIYKKLPQNMKDEIIKLTSNKKIKHLFEE